MYRKKYVYICDGCGKIEFPRMVKYGDLTDATALPEGWERAGEKHLCSECFPSRGEADEFRRYIAERK